jgi:hypothetical protein
MYNALLKGKKRGEEEEKEPVLVGFDRQQTETVGVDDRLSAPAQPQFRQD